MKFFTPLLNALHRRFSRGAWLLRLLNLEVLENTEHSRGLVLIQIDGLSRKEFNAALRKQRMPFLRKLLAREGYSTLSLYSGLPSTTPAVQGELFYGVKSIVPAFGFYCRRATKTFTMFDPDCATAIEKELALQGQGLLKEGSCYSNIFSGGAAEPHFCPAAFSWHDLLFGPNPFIILSLIALHFYSILRALGLLVTELILALFDCVRGALAGRNLWSEIRFIPSRIIISILLREIITAGAIVDIARGLPIIHLNFLGYDEQAHRRGPRSPFAHWSLKGIDRSIKSIWHAAKHSTTRDWQVWIYSDHGQETTKAFSTIHNKRAVDAIKEIIDGVLSPTGKIGDTDEIGRSMAHAAWISGRPIRPKKSTPERLTKLNDVSEVVGLGPLGHIYLSRASSIANRATLAQRLVNEAHIPMVLYTDPLGEVFAVTTKGCYSVAKDAVKILDSELPYFAELRDDLIALCRHPEAGDIIISGWKKGARPLSFAAENGAHGGPGDIETHAFFLYPTASLKLWNKQFIRPIDLRTLVQQYLGR